MGGHCCGVVVVAGMPKTTARDRTLSPLQIDLVGPRVLRITCNPFVLSMTNADSPRLYPESVLLHLSLPSP